MRTYVCVQYIFGCHYLPGAVVHGVLYIITTNLYDGGVPAGLRVGAKNAAAPVLPGKDFFLGGYFSVCVCVFVRCCTPA